MILALACLSCLLGPQSPTPVLKLGDDRIAVLAHGGLGPRLLPEAPKDASKARVWRVRVRIATDLRVGSQRIEMDAQTVDRVRAAVEEFGRTVLRWSWGRVRLDLDVATLAQPLRVADPGSEPFFLTPTAEADYGVSGRDVDSVFLIFPPGRRDLPMLGGTFGGDRGPDGAGSTGLAWVPSREDEMVRVLVHEWLHQIEWLARRRFGMAWLPGSHDREDLGFTEESGVLAALLGQYLSAEFWRKADMRGDQRAARLPSTRRYHWPAIATDPWRRLPLLDEGALGKLTGHSVEIELRGSVVDVRIDGVLPRPGLRLDARIELEQESVALLPVKGQSQKFVILVRGDRGGLFGRFLAEEAEVAGVLLPLRNRRRIDHWEAGGTATPLVVFVIQSTWPPRTEVELLALRDGAGIASIRRSTGAAVIGESIRFERVGSLAEVTVHVDGERIATEKESQVVPGEAGSVVIAFTRGDQTIPYRIPVAPRVRIELKPRSGPSTVVRSMAMYTCQVTNHTSKGVDLALESWAPSGVELVDLPKSLRLRSRESRALPCRVRVESGRPSGGVELRIVAREAEARLGQARLCVHIATGRDFLRLGFENSTLTLRCEGSRAADPGDWKARGRTGEAPVGRGFLRVNDGGGSRFGRHYLLAPSPVSFDTELFPYVTFFIRTGPRAGARAALNVAVGERIVSVPLIGGFLRAWDHRRELPGVEIRTDGRWQRVVYDLDSALDSALGEDNHRVSAIDIGDTRALCSNRYAGGDQWHFDLDDFAVVRTKKTDDRPAADRRGTGR